MCHRLLKLVKHTACGHNSFLGDSVVDCHSRTCFLSPSHPSTCNSPSNPCRCRRYYGQPERFITHQVPGKCTVCPP